MKINRLIRLEHITRSPNLFDKRKLKRYLTENCGNGGGGGGGGQEKPGSVCPA